MNLDTYKNNVTNSISLAAQLIPPIKFYYFIYTRADALRIKSMLLLSSKIYYNNHQIDHGYAMTLEMISIISITKSFKLS